MSFFDRQGIPESLLRNQAHSAHDLGLREKVDDSGNSEDEHSDDDDVSEHSEDDMFEDDIKILRNYSFISVVGTNRFFKMHALVQLATRKRLEINRQLEVWKERYVKHLSTEFPTGRTRIGQHVNRSFLMSKRH